MWWRWNLFQIYLLSTMCDAPIGDPSQLAEPGFQTFQKAKGVEADPPQGT